MTGCLGVYNWVEKNPTKTPEFGSIWRIIPVIKWLIGSPPFISHETAVDGRGTTTRSLGNLRVNCDPGIIPRCLDDTLGCPGKEVDG